MTDAPLPEYEKPPINEVVIGVQFEPLRGFRCAHLGLYWQGVRQQYPFTEDQSPLGHFIENPQGPSPGGSRIELLSGMPLPRCWFLDSTKTELLQLQPDRFLRNWRQVEGTEQYPRFPPLLEQFIRCWEGFQSFLREEKIGTPAVNQCELTYVNHIELSGKTADFSQAADVFSLLANGKKGGSLPRPEVVNWRAKYRLPDGRGWLNIQMDPAFRNRDLRPILKLELTARGAASRTSVDGLLEWFNLAHAWVVRAFDEVTEPRMHEIWKKL